MPNKINEGFSFFAKRDERCMSQYSAALKHYNAGFEAAVKLENEIPIFMDTNVLLRTYSSSFVDREKLKRFFDTNKQRIYITNQVQIEFMNNREGLIDDFYNNITNKIPDNFQTDVINKISHYYNTNKLILSDYPAVHKKIEKINRDVLTIHEEMKKAINASPQAKKDIRFVDDILDIYTQFIYTEQLGKDEIDFLRKDFDTHKAGFTSENINKLIGKEGAAFPGIGDIKEKPDDPYGDYIIFHEVLKYVKTHNKDAVILTYDTTKGDWIQFNGEPHVHYIVNTYLNTENTIYILDAKRVLQGLLEISPTSLTEIVEDEKLKRISEWGTSFSIPVVSRIISELQSDSKEINPKLWLNYIHNLSRANQDNIWALSTREYLNSLSKEAKSKALKDAIEKVLEETPAGDEDPDPKQ